MVVGSILKLHAPHIVSNVAVLKSELETHWRQDAAQTAFPVHKEKFRGDGVTNNGGFAGAQTIQGDNTCCLAVRLANTMHYDL